MVQSSGPGGWLCASRPASACTGSEAGSRGRMREAAAGFGKIQRRPAGVYSFPVSGWRRTVHTRLFAMLSARPLQAPGDLGRRRSHSARASSIQESRSGRSRCALARGSFPHATTVATRRSVCGGNDATTSICPGLARQASAREPPVVPGAPTLLFPTSSQRAFQPHGASPTSSRCPGTLASARRATASSRRDHSRIRVLADGADSRDGSAPRSNSTRAYDPSGAWGPTRDTIQYQSSRSRCSPPGVTNASRMPTPSPGPGERTRPAQRRASKAPTCTKEPFSRRCRQGSGARSPRTALRAL